MPRYFLEVAYRGTAYSGFQIQDNGITIQSELIKALETVFRRSFELTGSSRTDAGVHALQNFFHVDTDLILTERVRYNINAVLPGDIALNGIYSVDSEAHCRFDALSRMYRYHICSRKSPFLEGRAWQYPYPVSLELLQN